MRFTCLIPTFNNGAMIRASIESVLSQTVADLELFVVCDGAPPVTHAIADQFAAGDKRVRVFKFEKGERHGEASRHRALEEATGEVVCYLSDDDYWFPDHLETVAPLLTGVDFAHTRHTFIKPTFEFTAMDMQITEAETRRRMCAEKFNIFGPSVAGHWLSSYRRLPQGWAPAPLGVPTDLHMWRKWIDAGMRFAASAAVTTLHIPRATRGHQAYDTGLRETNFWRTLMRDPIMRQALRELIPPDTSPLPSAKVAARACELHRLHSQATAAAVAELERMHRQAAAASAAEIERIRASRLWRYALPARRVWRRIRDALRLDA